MRAQGEWVRAQLPLAPLPSKIFPDEGSNLRISEDSLTDLATSSWRFRRVALSSSAMSTRKAEGGQHGSSRGTPLPSPAVRGRDSDLESGVERVSHLVALAVLMGAPLFNQGDATSCCKVYTNACEMMLEEEAAGSEVVFAQLSGAPGFTEWSNPA